MLNETRYVWFNGKRYSTTFKRLSELVQSAVVKAMPEGYKFNHIQSSRSTESIYFSIINERKLYFFRVSSHKKMKDDNIFTIYTNAHKNFNDLSQSIAEYLINDNYLSIKFSHILFLLPYLNDNYILKYRNQNLFIVGDDYEIEVTNPKLTRILRSLSGMGLIYINKEQVKITEAGKSFLSRYKKYIPQNYLYLQLETVSAKKLLLMAINEKYRIDLYKERKKTVYPENAIKAYFENDTHSYSWFIPSRFRGKIRIGDNVKVLTKGGQATVTVIQVYVEDKENIKSMNPVIKISKESDE